MASLVLKSSLRALVAGDLSRTQSINISDAGVLKLTKTCNNLATVSLYGTRNLKHGCLPAILGTCAAIEAVTICISKNVVPDKTSIPSFLNWESGGDFAPNLRYLELRDIYHDADSSRLLDWLTRRPGLEIVHDWNKEVILIREQKCTAIYINYVVARKNAGKKDTEITSDDEDEWEDEPDSEDKRQATRKARKTRKAVRKMGREIRWLGVQSSMSEVLDRHVGDVEMETSFRDQWDFSDSGDEDMDPREMR